MGQSEKQAARKSAPSEPEMWAVFDKDGEVKDWVDCKGRSQFDIYTTRACARSAAAEWKKNSGEPHTVKRVRIEVIDNG